MWTLDNFTAPDALLTISLGQIGGMPRDPNGSDFNYIVQGFIIEELAVIPEPASIALWSLIGMGLAVFGVARYRRKR